MDFNITQWQWMPVAEDLLSENSSSDGNAILNSEMPYDSLPSEVESFRANNFVGAVSFSADGEESTSKNTYQVYSGGDVAYKVPFKPEQIVKTFENANLTTFAGPVERHSQPISPKQRIEQVMRSQNVPEVVRELNEKFLATQETLITSRVQAEQLEATIDNLSLEKDAFIKKIVKLEKLLVQQKQELNSAHDNEILSLKEEYVRIRSDFDDMFREKEKLEGKVKEISQKNNELQKQVQELTNRVAVEPNMAMEIKNKLVKEAKHLNYAEERIKHLTNLVNKKDEAIHRLSDEKLSLFLEKNVLKRKLDAMTRKVLETFGGDDSPVDQDLKMKIDELEEINKQLQAKLCQREFDSSSNQEIDVFLMSQKETTLALQSVIRKLEKPY